MTKFKKGDIVGRKSYNKDVIFEITNIIKTSNKISIYILKGINQRIEADSTKEDLELLDKRFVSKKLKENENRISDKIKRISKNSYANQKELKRNLRYVYTGKILHLDGDKKYSQKSARYYRNLGLNAIVKNIPENKQPQYIISLLEKYNPDVLVITRT